MITGLLGYFCLGCCFHRLNNCVGFSNYKFFLLFLVYSLLYCFFVAVTTAPYSIKYWVVSAEGQWCVSRSNPKSTAKFFCCCTHAVPSILFCTLLQGELPYRPAKLHVLFLMLVSLMFFVTLSFLLGFHCWLVARNRSTLGQYHAVSGLSIVMTHHRAAEHIEH